MRHRAFGNTGFSTAQLALGLVKLGRTEGLKYSGTTTIPSDAEARELFAKAQDLGINLLDTAPAYGNSEERLGTLLRGQRDQWLVSTKVGEAFDGRNSSYDFSAEACEKSVERSLKRLQTDYLDIVLIHSDGSDLDILQNHGTLEVLLTLKKAGKIRAVGMSHKTVAGAELAIEQGADVLMATLNPGYTDELGVIEAAAQAGVGVLIKKALSSGHGQASDLAWVAEQSGVGSIVIGTTNLDHLEQNVRLLAV
ncbi:MAG: aryl-alcohol dehydrogenase-like predicted oxidoreductase [Candidatus Azotimanducaceae bacterium]|jgi:aryl-alcohol dehydrogenase-like predicted oxidoreductase